MWFFNIFYKENSFKLLSSLQGVTKGARHKILLSIKKLNDRHSALESARSELAAGGAVLRALERVRAALLAPMPPVSDLPGAIVEALDLGKCLKNLPVFLSSCVSLYGRSVALEKAGKGLSYIYLTMNNSKAALKALDLYIFILV